MIINIGNLLLIIGCLITYIQSTFLALTPGTTVINSVTTYQYVINFANAATRSYI